LIFGNKKSGQIKSASKVLGNLNFK